MEMQELNADSSVESSDKRERKKQKGKYKNNKRKLESVEDDNDIGDSSYYQDGKINGQISSKKKKKSKSGKEGHGKSKPFFTLLLRQHFKHNKKLGERLKLRDIQELILYCTLRKTSHEQLSWCQVGNRKKIKKVVVILLRSVGENDFAQHVTSFPFITKELTSTVVSTNASGTDFTFQHAHETLLSVPLSKSQLKKKMKKSRDKINDNETLEKIHEDGCSSNKESYPSRGDKDLPAVPVDKSVFLLTKDQLKSNKYPVRCYDEAANDEDGFLPCITCDSPTNGNSEEQPVFAVDCEMCVTSEGHELTRISIIDESMNMLYDTLVKPGRPILDYKTKYSGITAESLEGVTVTLQDVQKQVTALLPPDAILAGHSLDCDLNALKMYHNKVIDTAVAYKDKRGGYFKPSLKFLAEFYLQKKIQKGSDGHCSIEDAKTCMELVKLKFQEGPTFGLAGNASEGLFDKMDSEKKTCSMLDYPYIANLCRSGGHNVVPCTSDSEIVLKAANLINSSDFTWIHLQAVQHFYERLKGKAMNEEQKEEVLKELDTRVREIYQDIPDDCLTLVILGCGDIREIIRLQRDPSPRTEELRKAVQEAKKGLCFMKFT